MRVVPLLLLALVASGCLATRPEPGPQPDASTTRWRSLLGCYQMGDGQFVLDSMPELKLNADRRGVRRVFFSTPPIVGGYWFVTSAGRIWVTRHDGLWGRTFEFTARGDSLIGREHLRTDVPSARPEPVPASAVRAGTCTVRVSNEAPAGER